MRKRQKLLSEQAARGSYSRLFGPASPLTRATEIIFLDVPPGFHTPSFPTAPHSWSFIAPSIQTLTNLYHSYLFLLVSLLVRVPFSCVGDFYESAVNELNAWTGIADQRLREYFLFDFFGSTCFISSMGIYFPYSFHRVNQAYESLLSARECVCDAISKPPHKHHLLLRDHIKIRL